MNAWGRALTSKPSPSTGNTIPASETDNMFITMDPAGVTKIGLGFAGAFGAAMLSVLDGLPGGELSKLGGLGIFAWLGYLLVTKVIPGEFKRRDEQAQALLTQMFDQHADQVGRLRESEEKFHIEISDLTLTVRDGMAENTRAMRALVSEVKSRPCQITTEGS